MTDDPAYFYARAERQLMLAERSDHPVAVQAHSAIANSYLDRAYEAEVEAADDALPAT